jgi:hypothetical protein
MIGDLNENEIDDLMNEFDERAFKDNVSLTQILDDKKDVNFDQNIINEIVLWKVNRYVSLKRVNWLSKFNELKNLGIQDLFSNLDNYEYNETKKEDVKKILKEMCDTNGIGLPMASTMLRFRNPAVFQIIDIRTFRMIFGDSEESKIDKNELDKNNGGTSIDIYFKYLKTLHLMCKEKRFDFSKSDRFLYQYDINQKNLLKKNK